MRSRFVHLTALGIFAVAAAGCAGSNTALPTANLPNGSGGGPGGAFNDQIASGPGGVTASVATPVPNSIAPLKIDTGLAPSAYTASFAGSSVSDRLTPSFAAPLPDPTPAPVVAGTATYADTYGANPSDSGATPAHSIAITGNGNLREYIQIMQGAAGSNIGTANTWNLSYGPILPGGTPITYSAIVLHAAYNAGATPAGSSVFPANLSAMAIEVISAGAANTNSGTVTAAASQYDIRLTCSAVPPATATGSKITCSGLPAYGTVPGGGTGLGVPAAPSFGGPLVPGALGDYTGGGANVYIVLTYKTATVPGDTGGTLSVDNVYATQ